MIENIRNISNPLTIIAIFAGIAEISGTAVLPFVTSENQSTYLWFLMIFPLLLVLLFFITLNFNHKVLYAPSDFSDESNFIQLITQQFEAAKTEIVQSVEKEVSEKVMDLEEKLDHNQLIIKAKEYYDSGNIDKSLECLNDALEIAESMAAYKLLALIRERQSNYEEAIRLTTKGIELKKGTIAAKASLYFNRACYKSLSEYKIDTILKDINEAILLRPELTDSVYNDSDLKYARKFDEFKMQFKGLEKILDSE